MILFVGLVVVSALVLVHATTGWRPGWCDTHLASAVYEPLCESRLSSAKSPSTVHFVL